MARKVDWLSAKTVSNKREPGYYPDGAGLYLQVSASGSKSWIFRFTLHGKAREMGLGAAGTVSLSGARERAASCRLLLVDGIDPIETRNAQSAQAALAAANVVSFKVCAEGYIAAHKAGWKNSKHAAQWQNTLKEYCYRVIGDLPVQSIDTPHVVKVLQPIWAEKPETASRVRGRMQSILDWAKVSKYRTGDNPARWKGHLDNLLAVISKEDRVKHHPALPYNKIGEFMQELRTQEGTAARALEFLILCASRTGEVIGAKPSEFDLDQALWTIPKERMKTKKEHKVPLSPRALAIATQYLMLEDAYVFPGGKVPPDTKAKPRKKHVKTYKPLSNMAMLALLKRMDRKDITVHGFRSSFRDWGAEQTAYPSEVLEMALAHSVGDKVEAAYRRSNLFEKRRNLANDWARHCKLVRKAGSNVVPLRARKARAGA